MHLPFPRQTINILLLLVILISLLAYLKLSTKPAAAPTPPLNPSEQSPESAKGVKEQTTPTPRPSEVPQSGTKEATASPSATLNPQTGWLIYANPQYGFSFEYPPTWKLSEFSQPPQPIVLVGTNENGQLAALTVTLQSWAVDNTPFNTATGSAFSYSGWQGHRTTTTQADTQLNFIQLTKDSPSGQALRVTWLNSTVATNPYTINAYLKPILASFQFTPSPKP